jgi:hypothetical protein
MALRQPQSMDECVYFTNRADKQGNKIKCWVFRELCPQCKEGLMGKPRDPKTGKPKIRAEEYACQKCQFTMEKEAYEDTLTANIEYVCSCSNNGEIQASFKRKKVQRVDEESQKKVTVDAIRFQCQKCGKNIDVTKKMK